MSTLFISDLHLDANLPELTELFVHFMREQAPTADAVYILGDLFEAWVGDDDDREGTQLFIDELRALSDKGVPLYIMQGNRDFLFAEGLVKRTGCKLLPDPTVIDLYGLATLLMHGDSLCTDDIQHQESRAMLRSDEWKARFLSQPLSDRIQQAKEYRSMSRKHLKDAPDAIMDVNAEAVVEAMQQHNVLQMIHGHTHRPDMHSLSVNGQDAKRIVLGDWGNKGSVLHCNKTGCALKPYSA
ncbi:MAG: UDP-2,3-diacylglucosamine diphosphatase [Sulfuriflexus sp.]|nr:UDP-2,3-diacylglucosamine diphosphatase [Sulfuriflexus sp.]